jgi:Fe-S-cluster containining protein
MSARRGSVHFKSEESGYGCAKTLHDADERSPISCSTCEACCCRLEVLLTDDGGIPPGMTVVDRWGGWVMRRLGDGWCAALDRNTMLCSIYEQRPRPCREFEMAGSECLEERSHIGDVYR